MLKPVHSICCRFASQPHVKTRIPSGIWSRLYGSFPSALNTWSKVWPWILETAVYTWREQYCVPRLSCSSVSNMFRWCQCDSHSSHKLVRQQVAHQGVQNSVGDVLGVSVCTLCFLAHRAIRRRGLSAAWFLALIRPLNPKVR